MDPVNEHPVRYCEYCGHYVKSPCSSLDSFESCLNVYFGDTSGETEKPNRVEVSINDPINVPHHYAQYKIEPITFIMENGLDFATGNVVKYTMRHKFKNGLEDLRKARKYLEFIAKLEYGEEL